MYITQFATVVFSGVVSVYQSRCDRRKRGHCRVDTRQEPLVTKCTYPLLPPAVGASVG